MKKNLLFYTLILLFFLLGCTSQRIKPESNAMVNGEWLYVGTFSHLADYACYVCPDFKPEEVIYKLTFDDDTKSISGRVRNLIITANYETNLATESTEEVQLGTFKITNFKVLNKPWENQEDGVFQDNLQKAFSYRLAQSTESKLYDELQLSTNEDALVFVRVR